MLRCLDLKEYVEDAIIASTAIRVRSDADIDDEDVDARDWDERDPDDEWSVAYSLGEVLCCFTTWSEMGTVDGGWAGCRFDITTRQHVDETWTNVSGSAVEALRSGHWDARKDGKRAYM